MRNNEDRFNPAPVEQQSAVPGLQYVVPTELVDLPSKGKFYPQDHPLHEKEFIEIKHMTTKEEDILSSTSLIQKGVVLDYLLRSIIVDKNIDPKSLLPGDQNAIYLSARVNAYGKDYAFTYTCDNCGRVSKVNYNLENAKNREIDYNHLTQDGLIECVLEKSNQSILIRQLNSKQFDSIEKQNKKNSSMGVGQGAVTSLLLSIIHSVNGELNDNGLKFVSLVENLPSADVRQIKKVYADTKPDVDFHVQMDCEGCGASKEGNVPITINFFWPDA